MASNPGSGAYQLGDFEQVLCEPQYYFTVRAAKLSHRAGVRTK